MKKLIIMFALVGLLAAPSAGLQAEKPVVTLAKKDHKKISQRVLGDMKKAKALNNFDRFLTVVALCGLGGAHYSQYKTLNSHSEVGKSIRETIKNPRQMAPTLPIATQGALLVTAIATALKIPVKLKRMHKEGYYVGLNPFKLIYNGIKFQLVDALV